MHTRMEELRLRIAICNSQHTETYKAFMKEPTRANKNRMVEVFQRLIAHTNELIQLQAEVSEFK